MTSVAHIPEMGKTQVKTPFAVICSFEVPTTDIDPAFVPSVNVCIGEYSTFADAKQSFAMIERHPALISAWCHLSLREEDYQ